MPKYPAEILGFSFADKSTEAVEHRKNERCPFLQAPCHKTNGICSVRYQDEIIAICPSRLLENRLVFENIADHYFSSRNDLLVFSEVYSGDPQLGFFDYVMVKHKPLSNDIEDFVVIEFQTVDTTNTGKLTKALQDFDAGQEISNREYGFGLNWSNVWKRCFIQILNKGRVLEKWGNRAYWVVQEPTYNYLLDAYGLQGQMASEGDQLTTVFMVYDLQQQETHYQLLHSRIQGTNIPNLLKAFSDNPHVPTREKFLNSLKQKMSSGINLHLRFDE